MPARALPPAKIDQESIASRLESEARRWAHQLDLPKLASEVAVRWNSRLRTTAGVAQSDRSLISLNPRLLDFPEELTRTLLHELAHLIAQARHPRRRLAPHGGEWQQACRDLGLVEERRCHSLPLATPRRLIRRYLYHCPCCLTEVPRVHPFRRSEACLACCHTHEGGRYHRRFRFVLGPAPIEHNKLVQNQLFPL